MPEHKEYKIGPRNSTVCGYPGRNYDWTKFCWDGNEVYSHRCGYKGHSTEEWKAPLPFVDSYLIAENCQYLHVPYKFKEQGTIYRVRPNDTMYAGEAYRGHLIKRQTAIKKEDGWYWVLEYA